MKPNKSGCTKCDKEMRKTVIARGEWAKQAGPGCHVNVSRFALGQDAVDSRKSGRAGVTSGRDSAQPCMNIQFNSSSLTEMAWKYCLIALSPDLSDSNWAKARFESNYRRANAYKKVHKTFRLWNGIKNAATICAHTLTHTHTKVDWQLSQ